MSQSSVRLRRIVAATDFSPESDRALMWAARLAADRGAELRLIHAVAWAETPEIVFAVEGSPWMELLAAARKRLAELAEPLREQVRAITCTATLGAPAPVILEEAAVHQAELLVLGTRGLRGWQHLVLGSNAQRTLCKAGCPVLIVHGDGPAPPQRPWRLLAATDGSPEADQAISAAVRLLDPASTEVILLRVFEPLPMHYSGVGDVTTYEVFGYVRSAADEQLRTEALALAAQGIAVSPLLRDGFPAEVIVNAATDLHADLVVVGTRGRGGLSHALLGSTAERVAQRSPVPVLAVPYRAAAVQREAGEALAIAGARTDEQC